MSRRSPSEEALERLERIVDILERGGIDLAASLAGYEKGVALLGPPPALLDGVDRSVAAADGVEDDGTPITSPFDAPATTDASRKAAACPVEASNT